MITLYQFPISHFCEKARWALDYKGLPWRAKNLLLGPHIKQARRVARHSTVPILVDGRHVVQNSSDIITYLDQAYPEKPLTPADAGLKDQALEWERYIDDEIGVHLRRFVYWTLLDYPEVVIPFFAHGGTWYAPLYYKILFPRLRKTMLRYMNINEKTADESRRRLAAAIERLHQHLDGHEFIVGDRFSRADLAAAALLAPLHKPKQYGLNWPARLPEKLEAFIEEQSERTGWVTHLYAHYR